MVDPQEVRHVMEEVCHADAMSATRCNSLPCLTGTEESALFTYSRLLLGSWSSLLEYFFQASVNTSGRLGKFNLILMSWTCAGTTARAILVSLATTSTSFNSLPCIGLLGVANKISELCSLHDLLLISLSPTLCASRVTGPSEKDIWPRLDVFQKELSCCRLVAPFSSFHSSCPLFSGFF